MSRKNNKKRNIKKIFQWQDYLNWNNMTPKQKINFKRACLFPLLVFVVYKFLTEYTYAILIIILIFFLIRLKNRRNIIK